MACNHDPHQEVIEGRTVDRCGICGEILWVYAPTLTKCERRALWGIWALMAALIALGWWV
jgi:hypothetical protein